MKIINALFFSVFTLLFMNCASYQFEKQPPFKVISAEYINTIGGLPNSGSTLISITYTSASDVKFDSIFYIDNKVKVNKKISNSKKVISGRFYQSQSKKNGDFVLHEDPKEEYGNTIPNRKGFNLKNTEAVISYYKRGKLKYYKIEKLKPGETVIRQ